MKNNFESGFESNENIEKNNSNPKNNGSSSDSKQFKKSENKVTGTTSSISNKALEILDASNSDQNLQQQLDRCIDFREGIEYFKSENIKAINLLKESIDESIRRNSLGDFNRRMSQHFNRFDEKIGSSLQLLEKQKKSFEKQASVVVSKMKAINEVPQYNNKISDGLANKTKDIFKK